MDMMKITKRGYFTIEAAIFLPVFIIALLTLAYIIRIICIEERITHIMTDEGRYLSTRAYDNRSFVSELKMGAILGIHLSERFNSEVKHNTDHYLTDYQYLIKKNGMSGIISYGLTYQSHVNLPINLLGEKSFEKNLLFRGFIGADYDIDSFDYELMEEENVSVIVWVFPKAGEKYHSENCRHIKVYPRQVIVTKGIMNRYKGCRHCIKVKMPIGSIAYIFEAEGGVYHKGSCFTVDRYVISMDLDTAESKGYTACKTCGGGVQ